MWYNGYERKVLTMMVRKLITTFSEQPNLTSSCLLASSMEDRGFGHIRDYFQNVVKF